MPYTIHQPIVSLTLLSRSRYDIEISSNCLVRKVREHIDWIEILSGVWKYNNEYTHINQLELNSVLLAVKWLSSLLITRTNNRKILMLVDNSVTIYTLRKGRSSSFQLLSVIRRISALTLAMNLELRIVYIPSEMNPADAASRIGITQL